LNDLKYRWRGPRAAREGEGSGGKSLVNKKCRFDPAGSDPRKTSLGKNGGEKRRKQTGLGELPRKKERLGSEFSGESVKWMTRARRPTKRCDKKKRHLPPVGPMRRNWGRNKSR